MERENKLRRNDVLLSDAQQQTLLQRVTATVALMTGQRSHHRHHNHHHHHHHHRNSTRESRAAKETRRASRSGSVSHRRSSRRESEIRGRLTRISSIFSRIEEESSEEDSAEDEEESSAGSSSLSSMTVTDETIGSTNNNRHYSAWSSYSSSSVGSATPTGEQESQQEGVFEGLPRLRQSKDLETGLFHNLRDYKNTSLEQRIWSSEEESEEEEDAEDESEAEEEVRMEEKSSEGDKTGSNNSAIQGNRSDADQSSSKSSDDAEEFFGSSGSSRSPMESNSENSSSDDESMVTRRQRGKSIRKPSRRIASVHTPTTALIPLKSDPSSPILHHPLATNALMASEAILSTVQSVDTENNESEGTSVVLSVREMNLSSKTQTTAHASNRSSSSSSDNGILDGFISSDEDHVK